MRCSVCSGDGFVTDEDEEDFTITHDRICHACRGTGFASGRLPADAPELAHRRLAEIRRGNFR